MPDDRDSASLHLPHLPVQYRNQIQSHGQSMMKHEGPARVFDCEEDAIAAIKGGKIVSGDVVVIRYEGPKGAILMISPSSTKAIGPPTAASGET